MEGGAAKIEHSKFRVARNLLLFWTLYVGLGAVAGAVGMLADPSGKAMGMDAMLPCFQKLPFADVLFSDLLFSGIALLIVNGITNLTAAGLLLAKKRAGIFLGGLFGVTLMLWILIQFYMFPLNFMSTAYFIFGFLQAATGYAAWVFDAQERFCSHPDPKAYPRILGTTPRGSWCISPAWATSERRRWKRRIARARSFMRSKRRSARSERSVFGGADVTECIAGRCRSKRCELIFRPMRT